MTIIEALKSNKIDRITVDHRCLVWNGENEDLSGYGLSDESIKQVMGDANRFIIYEWRRGTGAGQRIFSTESEDEAVKWLIGEE